MQNEPMQNAPIDVSSGGVSLRGDDDVPADIAEQMAEATLSRRNFLIASGVAAAGTLMAGCTGQPRMVVPTVREEAGIKPGQSYWYNTTCGGCSAACGAMGKSRDGRPIKLEGNPAHPLSQGGLCAKGQGSLLGLYDADRLKAPQANGTALSWGELVKRTVAALTDTKGKKVRVLTGTINSPSELRAMGEFLKRWPNAEHLSYDAIGHDAILDAHERSHGQRALPHYRFDKAQLIVTFGADFMGTWISPVEFSRAWADGRRVDGAKPQINRTVVLEGAMSLTGSNADQRFRVEPSQRGAALAGVYARLLKASGGAAANLKAAECTALSAEELDTLAGELWAARGKALVVSNAERVEEQLTVNAINDLLNAYGKTLSLGTPSLVAKGKSSDVLRLIKEMEDGEVGVLITIAANPVYNHPAGERFASAMAKVATSLVLTDRLDETAAHASIVGPLDHYLECWGDHEAVAGLYSLSQPLVRRLFTTEAAGKTLLALAESAWGAKHWRAYVRDTWRSSILGLGDQSWERCIESGLLDKRKASAEPKMLADALKGDVVGTASKPVVVGDGGYELVLFESVGLGDGRHANNPWLHELPDPLTKATWDNFATVSPATLKKLGAEEGDMVELVASAGTLSLPLISQPGLVDTCVAVALGYGRTAAGRLAASLPEDITTLGANAYPLVSTSIERVGLNKGSGSRIVARSQTHDSAEGRPLAAETTLSAYLTKRSSGTPEQEKSYDSMYKDLEHPGHYWGMAVDLNACNGCSGCIIGCQVENNVPVVGKDEVFRRRDMAWIRLDRYYSDDESPDDMYVVDSNPRVMHQPMMCQHCDNAPCETVCPVAATSHSTEGLNQQVYNRCVGTRYCANNCPYKVRRFNWFSYNHNDTTMNLVLNPDVMIRSRGVMEKCSLCVQRIYEAKLEASRSGRAFKDGDFKTACQQSCPTNAIVVGDLNDPESAVVKMRKSERTYEVLGELNVKAGARYLTRIRNTEQG